MTSVLDELTHAVAALTDSQRVLELSTRAIHDACGRGLAFGSFMTVDGVPRPRAFCVLHEGQPISGAPSNLALMRSPAFDVTDVPEAQRNRWIEPFRDGVASRESFRTGSIYPFIKRFGVFDQGRVAVCVGPRLVAWVGAAVPEEKDITAAERSRLVKTSSALVVPMRLAAVLADSEHERTFVERMLDTRKDAVVALDARGEVIDASRPAFKLLRATRPLADLLRDACRNARKKPHVVRALGFTVHVSPCDEAPLGYLAVIDGDGFAESPIALSKRQRELIALLADGRSNNELALAMHIKPATVKTMLDRLYQRAQVANRVELLAWARRLGVVG